MMVMLVYLHMQVVSYEEDLSGRQKIIDRAKSEAACLEKLVQLRERS